MLVRHQIVLFEMSFQMSSPDNRIFNKNYQPKLLKSAKVSTTENRILIKEIHKQLWLDSA